MASKRRKTLCRGKKHANLPPKKATASKNQFKFKNFGDQIDSITIEKIQKFGSSKSAIPGSTITSSLLNDGDSCFSLALADWRELNCSLPFASFVNEIYHMCGNLAQVLFYREEIIHILLESFDKDTEGLASAPFSALTANLSKDLGELLTPHFSSLLKSLVATLGRCKEVESIEVVLGSLFYFIKTLLPEISAEVVLGDLISSLKLRGLSPQVKDFLAEFTMFILRKNFSPKLIQITISGLSEEKYFDLLGCILAGSLQGSSKKYEGERVSLVLSCLDNSDLLKVLFLSMMERLEALAAWKVLVPHFENVKVIEAITEITRKHSKLVDSHSLIFDGLCSQLPSKFTQDAIISICKISDLSIILAQRPRLRSHLNDIRGISLIINNCPSLLDPIIGAFQVMVKLSEALTLQDQDKYEILTLIQTIVTSYPATLQKAPWDTLNNIIDASQEFEVTYRSLAILLKAPSTQNIAFIPRLIKNQDNYSPDRWISLLELASDRLADLDLNLILPFISRLDVLRIIMSSNLSVPSAFSLIPLLSSSNTQRQSSILHILSRLPEFSNSNILNICLQIDSVPWNFNCDREKGLHLQTLIHAIRKSPASVLELEMVINFLVGMLLVGFSPMKNDIYKALDFFAESQTGIIRKVFLRVIQELSQLSVNASPCISTKLALSTDPPLFGENSIRPLVSYLAHRPTVTDLLYELLLDLSASVLITKDLTIVSPLFAKSFEACLGDLLFAFRGMKSAKHSEKYSRILLNILDRFVAFGASNIQKKALGTLVELRFYDGIKMHEERLLRLLDDKEMRDELIILTSEQVNMSESSAIWASLCPILIKLLYGRMISRQNVGAGKNSMLNRRKLILNYMATWPSQSLHEFLLFLNQMSKVGSMEKSRGLLNLLQLFVTKVGKRLREESIEFIFGLMESFEGLNCDSELSRDVKKLTLRRLLDIYSTCDQDLSRWDHRAWSMVSDRVSRFELEFVQESSTLLDLLHLWMKEDKYRNILTKIGLDVWPRLAAALSSDKGRDFVFIKILEIWHIFIQQYSPDSMDPKLIDLLSMAINKRLESENCSKRQLEQAINVLQTLTNFISKESQKSSLIKSILRILPSKQIRQEEIKAGMLRICCKMYTRDLASEIYPIACKMLGVLRERGSRYALAELFGCLSRDNSELCLFSEILCELHSPSLDRIGEYDYERQVAAFSTLKERAHEFTLQVWSPVLQSMFYFSHEEEDTAGRTLAFSILSLFVRQTTVNPTLLPLLMSSVYSGVKKGLKSKHEGVRVDFLNLLNTIISVHCKIDPFSTLEPLLCGGDDEANILLNLLHLQQHRRSRALKRLGEFALSPSGKLLSKSTIEDLLAPILIHFVMSDPNENNPVPPLIVHDATMALAALYSRLPSKTISSKVLKLISTIKKGSPAEKALVKLIPAIFKNVPEILQGDTILSQLFGILLSSSNSTEIFRAPIAVAIAQLLPLLGGDAIKSYLPKLVTGLATILAHKHQDKRDEARSILAEILSRLGESYLSLVLKELGSVLSSGWRPHILAYTLSVILPKLTVLDDSIPEIMEIIVGDMFGRRAEEKKISEWTGKIMEVKAQKSSETLTILVERVSIDRISEILLPLKEAASSSKNQDCVEVAGKAFETGIIKRSAISEEDDKLVTLAYLLLNNESTFYEENNSKNWLMHKGRFQLSGGRILLHLLKQRRVKEYLLNQTIQILSNHIFANQTHSSLITACLKCFCLALQFSHASSLTDDLLQNLLKRLFDLILKSNATNQPDLVNSSFKLISTLVRERDHVQLTESQLRALLTYIRNNLEKDATIAYTLIKAILCRKVLLVEVYELMAVISRLMLRSHHSSVRQQCRSVYQTFLLDYPLAKPKLEEHFSFITANLNYEVDGGRESIALFLGSLIDRLPEEVANEISETWLVSLAARLVNEESEKVIIAIRGAAAQVVSKLSDRGIDRITMIIEKWIANPNLNIQKTAWNLTPILVESAKIPITALIKILLNNIESCSNENLIIEKVMTLKAIIHHGVLLDVGVRTGLKILEEYGKVIPVEPRHSLVAALLTNAAARLESGWLLDFCKASFSDLKNVTDGPISELIIQNLLVIAERIYSDREKFKLLLDLMEKKYRHVGGMNHFGVGIFKFIAGLLMRLEIELDVELATPIMYTCLRPTDNTDCRLASQQVQEMLMVKLGKDETTDLRLKVINSLSVKKRKRIEEAAKLAIIDPQAYSKRRLERAARRNTVPKRKRTTH